MTATSQQIVTRAFRRLQAIDINEQPSAAEMTHGISLLEEIIDGLGAQGITTQTQTIAGNRTADSDAVSGVDDMSGVMIGLNVTGTGIPTSTRVKEVSSATRFKMTADATADSESDLTLAFLPVPAAYEGALIALLAVRLSEDIGVPVSAKLQMDASDGLASFLAGYIPDRKAVFDREIATPAGAWNINSDTAA